MAMARGLALVTSCLAFASAYVTPLLPPVAMPPARPVLPALSAQASAAAVASSATASVSRPMHASISRPGLALRGRMPVRAVPIDSSEVETKLVNILSDTNATAARLYSEADLLRLPSLANGEPSVRFLLAQLEISHPPPAAFDKNELVGKWQLVYTNDLPLAVREEVARHADGLVEDMSVVLSISDKGAMSKTTVVSRLGAESATFNEDSSIVQIGSSPSFTVTRSDGESMSAQVTYSSNELLVMRKEDDTDKWISEALKSIVGVPPFVTRVDVWKRISVHGAETPSAASPKSLWRFGLPTSVLRTTTGDTNMLSTSPSPTSEPSQNYSMYTWFLFAMVLVSAMAYFVRSQFQKRTQPRVEATELASYGESSFPFSPSMDEEQQCQTPSPTDDSSSWFSLARIRAVFLSALAALSLNLYEPSAHAARSGGRIGGSARAARTRSPSPRASPQLRSNTTVIERNNTTVIAPPPVGFSPGFGMGGPVIVAPAPTLGDIVVGAAVDGAVRGAVSGAIGGPHHGPSSTDRMLENQQRQDERQIDKQATEIEALKKKLEKLKAECKSSAANPDACAW